MKGTAAAYWYNRSSLERRSGRLSVLLGCRPEASHCWLERGFLRSSESSLCLVARATNPSLERACVISVVSSGITFHFFFPFDFKTIDSTPSLSTLTFSLGIDLLRVGFYPKSFVRKIEGGLGCDLIWEILVLEHFGFLSTSLLGF